MKERYNDLKKLCESNPVSIPLRELAKFLGISEDGLRMSALSGRCPFIIAWQMPGTSRASFKVSTLAFYNWVMQRASPELYEK